MSLFISMIRLIKKNRSQVAHGMNRHPFTVEDPGDHAETPFVAFEHIAPVLRGIARRLGKAPADLRVYDPSVPIHRWCCRCDPSGTCCCVSQQTFDNVNGLYCPWRPLSSSCGPPCLSSFRKDRLLPCRCRMFDVDVDTVAPQVLLRGIMR